MNVPPSKKASVYVVSEKEEVRKVFEDSRVFFATCLLYTSFEDFAEDSGHVLEELSRYTEDNEWKLYRMHFFLMEERKEEGKELLELLETISQRDEFTPLEANYFLYLKAMYYRTPEAISKAVSTIREFYELSEYKAEALWMLIYLDREYVYNKRCLLYTSKRCSCIYFLEE